MSSVLSMDRTNSTPLPTAVVVQVLHRKIQLSFNNSAGTGTTTVKINYPSTIVPVPALPREAQSLNSADTGTIRSGVGCRSSAGILGWHIPALLRDPYCIRQGEASFHPPPRYNDAAAPPGSSRSLPKECTRLRQTDPETAAKQANFLRGGPVELGKAARLCRRLRTRRPLAQQSAATFIGEYHVCFFARRHAMHVAGTTVPGIIYSFLPWYILEEEGSVSQWWISNDAISISMNKKSNRYDFHSRYVRRNVSSSIQGVPPRG